MHLTFSAVKIPDISKCIILCIALLALSLHGQQETGSSGQSAKAPTGKSVKYDPNYEPRMDPNHPDFDPNYDAVEDANHPLKSTTDPGEAWDTNYRTDGTPFIRNAKGDWSWGELYYGMTYPTQLIVSNECDTTQTITITTENLPFLEIPSQITVRGNSKAIVKCTIKTPPKPKIPFIPAGQAFPPQGIYLEVDGKVTLWHAWTPPCDPKRVVYKVYGHVHFPPEAPEKDKGPTTIATTDPCVIYWNSGEPPPQLETDCTDTIRALALHYREQVLQSFGAETPEAWEWIPGVSQLSEMSVEDLIQFKEDVDMVIKIVTDN